MKTTQMTIIELLEEKSYLEQQTGCNAEVLLAEVMEEIEKRFNNKETEELKEVETIVLSNNRERKMTNKKASRIAAGDIIITEVNGRGRNQVTKAELVETVEEISTHFVLVNGTHKIKKSTDRVIFLGYGKFIN